MNRYLTASILVVVSFTTAAAMDPIAEKYLESISRISSYDVTLSGQTRIFPGATTERPEENVVDMPAQSIRDRFIPSIGRLVFDAYGTETESQHLFEIDDASEDDLAKKLSRHTPSLSFVDFVDPVFEGKFFHEWLKSGVAEQVAETPLAWKVRSATNPKRSIVVQLGNQPGSLPVRIDRYVNLDELSTVHRTEKFAGTEFGVDIPQAIVFTQFASGKFAKNPIAVTKTTVDTATCRWGVETLHPHSVGDTKIAQDHRGWKSASNNKEVEAALANHNAVIAEVKAMRPPVSSSNFVVLTLVTLVLIGVFMMTRYMKGRGDDYSTSGSSQ